MEFIHNILNLLNITKGGNLKFDDDENSINDTNIAHKWYDNNVLFTFNGNNDATTLIRYRTSPNPKLNLHYLDITRNTILKYDSQYNGELFPILAYLKFPKNYDNDLVFELILQTMKIIN